MGQSTLELLVDHHYGGSVDVISDEILADWKDHGPKDLGRGHDGGSYPRFYSDPSGYGG